MTDYQQGNYQEADAIAPHCNTEVLHAPGTCWACDLYPDRQAMRAASGTPFTPAIANGWPGNVAQPPDPMYPPSARLPRPYPVDWGKRPPQPSLRARLRKLIGLR